MRGNAGHLRPLRWPRLRSTPPWRLLVQPAVRPIVVVVRHVLAEQPAKMGTGDTRPVASEASAVPAQDRLGLDDHQRIAPPVPELVEHDPEGQVGGADARVLLPDLVRRKLLAEGQIF